MGAGLDVVTLGPLAGGWPAAAVVDGAGPGLDGSGATVLGSTLEAPGSWPKRLLLSRRGPRRSPGMLQWAKYRAYGRYQRNSLVSVKFKAHVHSDLVSADTSTLLVAMTYLEAQSVHFSQKNLTRSNQLKGFIFNIFF